MAAQAVMDPQPRISRPAYPYRYGPNFPPSVSISMFIEPIGDAWPADHHPTPPVTDFPTDLATHRRQCATKIANNINRRGTDSALPRPELGHSAPTVANSRLTASVSGNDISQPTPKPPRLRFPNLRRDNTPTCSKPSRIPTPVRSRQLDGDGFRDVSTPMLPSQKARKENVQRLQLLRPISPTRQQAPLLKSRTMGMLSSLTSSFAHSNINLVSTRQVSAPSARTSDPITSISSTSSPPVPTFTINFRHIHTARPSAYWCGRFQALQDRFNTEETDLILSDPAFLKKYVPTMPQSTSLSNITNIVNNSRYQSKTLKTQSKTPYERMMEFETTRTDYLDRLISEETENRIKKVLLHLEALCVTHEAKKSLWEWQLPYARTARNEKYLPQGGRLFGDQKRGWVGRMGRMVSGGMSASVTLSNMGGRGGSGVLGRKKEIVIGLRQHDQGHNALSPR